MGVNDIRKWRVFRKIVAISGIIQGLAWLILAAICIGMYFGKAPKGFTKIENAQLTKNNYYTDLLSFCFYDTLLNNENNWESRLLKPSYFQIWVWLYAVLSAFWFGLALSECIGLFRRKTSKFEAHVLMVSGIVIILTCILDLTVMSLAFYDYSQINIFYYDELLAWDTTAITPTTSVSSGNLYPKLINEDELLTNSENDYPPIGRQDTFEANIDLAFRYIIGRKTIYVIFIAISTRGFLTWIFNCVSGILLLLISVKIFRAPPILKYDNKSIPRPKINLFPKDTQSLNGLIFADDNNSFSTPPFERKRYSLPPGDWYRHEPSQNHPLALRDKNRRNDNMFS